MHRPMKNICLGALFIIRITSQKLRLLEFNFDEHIDMPWNNLTTSLHLNKAQTPSVKNVSLVNLKLLKASFSNSLFYCERVS